MAVKSRPSSQRLTPFLRLAYSAPALEESTVAELRRFTLPATKALPFVKLRANDQPLWRPESFWHVKSTGKRATDLRLGRRYAREAIAAMKADNNSHLIAHIIQDIIKDAADGARKKGRCGYGPIVLGFLAGLRSRLLPRCNSWADRNSTQISGRQILHAKQTGPPRLTNPSHKSDQARTNR